MADKKRPSAPNELGQHVDKVNVDGKVLSADEILEKARQRLKQKHQQRPYDGHFDGHKKPKTEVSSQPTQEEINAIKAKNNRARTNIVSKKPSLKNQEPKTSAKDNRQVSTSSPNTASDNDRATLVKGSAWLSAGNIVSRVLGAVYIVPWMALLGTNSNRANALFGQGYNIYGMFLAIATFGIPAAISKLVAEFDSRNDVYRSRQLTRQSLMLGVVLGIVFGIAIYVMAPMLSNGHDNFIPVLRSLAPAVAIFPLMSMIRGIFQGHQLMSVSALSQVIEQIARIAYMLVTSITILSINPNNWTAVVVQSTFAAFIGAIFSMIVLGWGWIKYHSIVVRSWHPSAPLEKTRTFSMIVNILKESWPFIIIGSAITLFQLVDQYTYFNIMNHFFTLSSEQLEVKFALFSANPNKLIMIIVPFSTSIAATALPMLSGSKATLTHEKIQAQLEQVIKLFALVMLPSTLGMFAIAGPLYKMFYPIDVTNQEGIYLLEYSTILAIAFSLFMLLSFILQALSEVSIVIKSFVIGLVIKLAFQIPLVRYFEGMGALMASVLGMAVAVAYMLDYLNTVYGVSLSTVSRELWQMFVGAAIMAVIVYLIVFGFSQFILPEDNKLSVTITALLSAGIGGIIVITLYLRMGFVSELLGNKMRYIPRILRPKQ